MLRSLPVLPASIRYSHPTHKPSLLLLTPELPERPARKHICIGVAIARSFKKILVIAGLLFPLVSNAWWNCDWDYRFPAEIRKPPGPPLGDTQVRMDLNASNVPAEFDWNNLGDDLRAIDEDDLTSLEFFIEQWDAPGETAIVWVRVPSIPGAGRDIYFYFSAPPGTPSASTPAIFTQPGLKFHTRNTAVNPFDRASAEAAFNAASDGTNGYGCEFIDNYTGVNNRNVNGPPNRVDDFGLFAEVFFDVAPGEAGVWQFRYGADFGRGGGLYVDDVALDEDWNSDLWWALNWNNTSEILQGSANLAAGTHSLRILGFEGCCDGGLTAQFQRPGGPWLAVALSNIALSSRACPIQDPTVTYGPVEANDCPIMTITRSTQVMSDPINLTVDPKSIPGAIILNTAVVTNSGIGPADADTFVITEAVPVNMALRVADFDLVVTGPVRFADGTPSSGLTYSFVALGNAGDDVDFSDDNGATYTYTPVPGASGADTSVTNIRISPNNAFLGNSGSGDPSATFEFQTVVQ